MANKPFLVFSLLIFLSLSLSACSPPAPETVVETVIVEKEAEKIIETVVVTAESEEEIPDECCDTYRVGIFEEPVSLNYWHYLGLGGSIWTEYVISDNAAHLFELSDQRFKFVPSLAKDIPDPEENDDGTWSIVVNLIEDAAWSDGEPITANDVVFTHEVCRGLGLTLFWPKYCSSNGADVTAEMVDEYTVEYIYHNQAPSLSNWQFGIALAPILPQHFWADVVAEAYGSVEDLETPTVDRPEDCQKTNLNAGDQDACDTWTAIDDAYANARSVLYEADATGQPVAGGYTTIQWERGVAIERTLNQKYYFKGTEIIEYEDGTWMRILPDGTEQQFYGDAEGDVTLRYVQGPYNPGITFRIYNSQEAAFLALLNGEIDYVLNPLPLSHDLRKRVEKNEKIKTYSNADYDMFYLAFNMREYPMSENEFRQAFDILIDKNFIINQVLGGVVDPLCSTMPTSNTFWHNPEIQNPYVDLSRAERIEMAVQILKDADWSWESEPYWDDTVQGVVAGAGLMMPNGEPMPELTILGPGPAFDPIRATFNQWISEWARELGMPVKPEMTGYNAIKNSALVSSDYDMYIFGWGLGNPGYPVYYERYWHSRRCTFETGWYNSPCYKNDEYDILVDEFMNTNDLEQARELVYKMQILLANHLPYIPLYSQQVYDFARDNIVFPYTDALNGIEYQAGFQTSAKVLIVK
ncbi:MAG: ABC transporter substrate-binding protein [Chloroflexota bacterium]|nr:ABC transporter substrate-binding protein [Chloroflexota bacterium]